MDIALIIGIPCSSCWRRSRSSRPPGGVATDAEGRITGTLSGRDQGQRFHRPRGRRRRIRGGTRPAPARPRPPSVERPATRGATGVAEFTPAEYEEIQVSRRQFFNRAILATMAITLGAFGAAAIAFLYAKSRRRLRRQDRRRHRPHRRAGLLGRQQGAVLRARGPHLPPAVPEGGRSARPRRSRSTRSSSRAWSRASSALYQKCVHLGCRVPWCQTSQWFECPCHGSKYNRVGEKRGGPAPRGLDHWVVTVSGDKITIDTSGTPSHRPSDRHRHHRPGRRRPAVRLSRPLSHSRLGASKRPL